jgi:hypothetical protein
MDKLKRAGKGYWFWLAISVLWIFSSTLHLIAQLHSEKQELLLLWDALLIFWVCSALVISGRILFEYIKPETEVEKNID